MSSRGPRGPARIAADHVGTNDDDDRLSAFSEAEEVLGSGSVNGDEGGAAEEGGEEEEGEDLFGDGMLRDYAPRPDLDHYDPTLLDDSTNVPEIRPEDRRRVERALDARDRREARVPEGGRTVRRFYSTLEDLLEDEEEDDAEGLEAQWRRRGRRERMGDPGSGSGQIPLRRVEQAKEELPHCDGQTGWSERIEEIIEVLFTGLICHYVRPNVETAAPTDPNATADSNTTYLDRISQMAHDDASSLYIEWSDLRDFSARLADWTAFVPTQSLEVLDSVVTKLTQQEFPKLYVGRRITGRLRGFQSFTSIRNLNTSSLNQLICVHGVVVRRTNVFPKLKLVYLECVHCGCDTNGPYEHSEGEVLRMKRKCENCQRTGPFTINRERTVYENYQKLVIQEPPNSLTAGHVPRQKYIVVLGDLVDSVKPGDEVVVTGTYQTKLDVNLNAKSGFPIFGTQILVNNLQRKHDIKMEELTELDVELIHRLSKNKFVRSKIIDSIAPSLWGHRHIKTALAYAMFGGVRKITSGNHTIRGDINVLLLGDPGMGKSQFLKYIGNTFDRTISTTGKGASAVGLTAAVRRDPMTGEWCLEGGALVLADEGICLIDEFDKMSDQDRTSIHEAMEQQTISISKAGIVTTLRARCAVVAAANPIFGRYDNSLTFVENVDLTDPILSRFDVLAVMKDQVNPIQDDYLADHVVESHLMSHPDSDAHQREVRRRLHNPDGLGDEETNEADTSSDAPWITGPGRVPQEFLKKYIFYARRHCFPEIRMADEAKLTQFYSQLRQAANRSGGIPLTVRHLESVMRMATANAKMRLSNFVGKSDLDFAMGSMLESFIQSQKCAVAANLGRQFGRYRALAASPYEFLETLIIDLLRRKGRELLNKHYARAHIPTPLNSEGVAVLNLAETSMLEIKTLAKTLYDIPYIAIQKFVHSERFSSKFQCRAQSDNEVFIGRKIAAAVAV